MTKYNRTYELLVETAEKLTNPAYGGKPKSYKYALYDSSRRKIKDFPTREEAEAYADDYSFKKVKPQVNPNFIVPADVYYIKMINLETNKSESEQIYTANIRIRK